MAIKLPRSAKGLTKAGKKVFTQIDNQDTAMAKETAPPPNMDWAARRKAMQSMKSYREPVPEGRPHPDWHMHGSKNETRGGN